MRKKQWILLGVFLLFAVVAFLFSPAGGPGFSRDAMKQAEDAAFGGKIGQHLLVGQLVIEVILEDPAILMAAVHTGDRRPERIGLEQKLRGELSGNTADIGQLGVVIEDFFVEVALAFGHLGSNGHTLLEGLGQSFVAGRDDMGQKFELIHKIIPL